MEFISLILLLSNLSWKAEQVVYFISNRIKIQGTKLMHVVFYQHLKHINSIWRNLYCCCYTKNSQQIDKANPVIILWL